jgi:hypothetical protein
MNCPLFSPPLLFLSVLTEEVYRRHSASSAGNDEARRCRGGGALVLSCALLSLSLLFVCLFSGCSLVRRHQAWRRSVQTHLRKREACPAHAPAHRTDRRAPVFVKHRQQVIVLSSESSFVAERECFIEEELRRTSDGALENKWADKQQMLQQRKLWGMSI